MAPKKTIKKDTRNLLRAVKQSKKQTKQVGKTYKSIGKAIKSVKKAAKKATKKSVSKKAPAVKRKTHKDIAPVFKLSNIKQLQGLTPLRQLEYMKANAQKFDRLKAPGDYFVGRFFGKESNETRTYKNATLFATALEGSDSGIGGRSMDEQVKLLNGIEVVKVQGISAPLEQERKIQTQRAANKARMESIRSEAKQVFGATKNGRTKGFVELLNDAIQERKASEARIAKQDTTIADLLKRLTALEKGSTKFAPKKGKKNAAKGHTLNQRSSKTTGSTRKSTGAKKADKKVTGKKATKPNKGKGSVRAAAKNTRSSVGKKAAKTKRKK